MSEPNAESEPYAMNESYAMDKPDVTNESYAMDKPDVTNVTNVMNVMNVTNEPYPKTEQHPWRPTRRRLTDTLIAALAPVAVCSLALGGLTTWVGAGKAGSPARIAVSSGRVFLPYGDSTETAAFFDVSNLGGADDRLVRVTSSATGGEIGLSTHRTAGSGAAYKQAVSSAPIPAGGELSMSPHGVDVILRPKAGWRTGDLVPFTLHFERSGPVETIAVVVRPSDGAS